MVTAADAFIGSIVSYHAKNSEKLTEERVVEDDAAGEDANTDEEEVHFAASFTCNTSRALLDREMPLLDGEPLPRVLIFRPAENEIYSMPPGDSFRPGALATHVAQVVAANRRQLFFRFTRQDSQKLWQMQSDMHVLVLCGDADSPHIAKLATLVARRISAKQATVLVVESNAESAGLRRYVGAESSQNTSVAHIAVVDRRFDDGIYRKYQLAVDGVLSPLPLPASRETVTDVLAFLRKSLAKELPAFWRSAPVPDVAAGSAADEMGPVRKLVGTTFASFRSSQKHDMVLALTANWCHPCGHYRKALDEIGAAFAEDPELEVAIIDVDENEIVHLLGGVQLRRLPWRFSMPLVFVPRHSSGGAAEIPFGHGFRHGGAVNLDALREFVQEHREINRATEL